MPGSVNLPNTRFGLMRRDRPARVASLNTRLWRNISLAEMIVEFCYAAKLNLPGRELSDGSTRFDLDTRKLCWSKLENSTESLGGYSNISGSAGMGA